MQVVILKGFTSNNERARYLFHWSQSNPEESFPRVEHDLWNPENSCSLNSWTSSLGTTSTPVLDNFKGIFLFFVGMPAAYFRSKNGDPLDTTQRAESAAARAHFTFGDCIPLRADL